MALAPQHSLGGSHPDRVFGCGCAPQWARWGYGLTGSLQVVGALTLAAGRVRRLARRVCARRFGQSLPLLLSCDRKPICTCVESKNKPLCAVRICAAVPRLLCACAFAAAEQDKVSETLFEQHSCVPVSEFNAAVDPLADTLTQAYCLVLFVWYVGRCEFRCSATIRSSTHFTTGSRCPCCTLSFMAPLSSLGARACARTYVCAAMNSMA
jgi:hypothetical protein